MGLSTLYRKDASGHKVIRRVLALPLLPAEHIRPAFIDQQTKAEAHEKLTELFNYIQETWVDGRVWKAEDWSVYGQAIRTNNDCEGNYN